jgi:flagellar biosynthetic protein FliR
MSFTLSTAAITAFFLALVRGTTFLYISPPFTTGSIPFAARTAIAGGLAVAAFPRLEGDAMPASTIGFVGAVVVQAAAGALIGLVVLLFVGAVQGAGLLLDQFSGLNLPPAIDPLSLEQIPILAQLYEWMATILLFSSGGVVLLARGFIASFGVVGTTIPAADLAALPNSLASDIVAFFSASVEIAAPLVAVLFVAQALIGLLAKTAPQAGVFQLGFPFQILLALLVLGVSVASIPNDVTNLLERALGQLFG